MELAWRWNYRLDRVVDPPEAEESFPQQFLLNLKLGRVIEGQVGAGRQRSIYSLGRRFQYPDYFPAPIALVLG
jgi:hypothetical protein